MQQYLPYFFGLCTCIAIILGGKLAFRLQVHLKPLIAFCGGSLVAVALMNILPEAVEISGNEQSKSIFLITLISFLIFLFIDKTLLVHGHSHTEQVAGDQHHKRMSKGFIYGLGIVIHTFLDGLIVGTSFLIDSTTGIMIGLIILFHDFIDGVSTVTLMLKHHQTKASIYRVLVLAGSLTLAGIIISQTVSLSPMIYSYIMSFFAGFFLYLGASDLLPEAHEDRSSIKLVLVTILGVLPVVVASFVIH